MVTSLDGQWLGFASQRALLQPAGSILIVVSAQVVY